MVAANVRLQRPEPDAPGDDQPAGRLVLHHEVRSAQAAPRLEQAAEQRGRDPERRVPDDGVGPARQAEVGGIRLHDGHGRAEPISQDPRSTRVHLDRDHPSADVDERCGDRAEPGADVEHQVAASYRGEDDETLSPRWVEEVTAPRP